MEQMKERVVHEPCLSMRPARLKILKADCVAACTFPLVGERKGPNLVVWTVYSGQTDERVRTHARNIESNDGIAARTKQRQELRS